ncbi:related to phosphoesterases [Rhynchosporium secalis]|uniref:Related to phosphoesterases n=1 Tax=Rhynchosporium secalis TaxID=38038 RepID=A0A1E1MJU5_RHYSE|nr:related to phosphoesterases [Rhynchosporium secalis]
MPDALPVLRRTRFVCISDTHNACPGGAFKLPKGDVLIHAGDMTNQGSYLELKRTIDWLEEADFEKKIVIAGNHDITLDTEFYAQHGHNFHNQTSQDPVQCQELLERSSTITWLRHESAVIKLTFPTGPRTRFKIFGSPYSPAEGLWAFGYCGDEAEGLWSQIPLDADIVLTHTPPRSHLDERKGQTPVGCVSLRKALWRVRPRLAICGHVHDGRGAERIRWDLDVSDMKYKEETVEKWTDPGAGNKKMSLVDLTLKGRNPIANNGRIGDSLAVPPEEMAPSLHFGGYALEEIHESGSSAKNTTLPAALPPANHGRGGLATSQTCDVEGLSRRLGRRETCIINAAIAASNYPHTEGRKFHKPIVVDIDLPIWSIEDRETSRHRLHQSSKTSFTDLQLE